MFHQGLGLLVEVDHVAGNIIAQAAKLKQGECGAVARALEVDRKRVSRVALGPMVSGTMRSAISTASSTSLVIITMRLSFSQNG